MWLSKMLCAENGYAMAERGTVTISDNDKMEIGASATSREVMSYSPYGYSSTPPVGEEIILLPSSDGQIALGTRYHGSTPDSGEVKISSQGGAYIVLRNDGMVEINSMIINRDGVIRA